MVVGSTGTAVGGTSVGGTSVGGTSVGGTSVGGTSVGGTSVGGTCVATLVGSGSTVGGISQLGVGVTGTSVGSLVGSVGTFVGTTGTSVGGTVVGTTCVGGAGGTFTTGSDAGGMGVLVGGTSVGSAVGMLVATWVGKTTIGTRVAAGGNVGRAVGTVWAVGKSVTPGVTSTAIMPSVSRINVPTKPARNGRSRISSSNAVSAFIVVSSPRVKLCACAAARSPCRLGCVGEQAGPRPNRIRNGK